MTFIQYMMPIITCCIIGLRANCFEDITQIIKMLKLFGMISIMRQ